MRFDRKQIAASFKAVRRQLTSDHIDHYQLHWPDRATNDFGRLGYRHEDGAAETPIEETLDALDAVVQAGKVRHVGLSNENPWGVMRFLALAGQGRGPRVVSVQNPYSLLNRSYEKRLAAGSICEES